MPLAGITERIFDTTIDRVSAITIIKQALVAQSVPVQLSDADAGKLLNNRRWIFAERIPRTSQMVQAQLIAVLGVQENVNFNGLPMIFLEAGPLLVPPGSEHRDLDLVVTARVADYAETKKREIRCLIPERPAGDSLRATAMRLTQNRCISRDLVQDPSGSPNLRWHHLNPSDVLTHPTLASAIQQWGSKVRLVVKDL